jgi:hypothetical protein
MSVASKAKAFITGEAEDTEVEKCFARLREYEVLGVKTEEEVTKLAYELEQTERAKFKAATLQEITGKAGDYEKLTKNADKLRNDLQRKRDSLVGLRDLIAEAKAEAHKLGVEGLLKMQRRINNQRKKAAEEFVDTIGKAIKAAVKLHELNGKNILAWPIGTVGQVPNGAILGDRELEDAIVNEITRQAPYDPINQRFTFPGSHVIVAQGAPHTYRTLVQEIEQANDYLLRRIEIVPTPTIPIEAFQSAPLPSEEILEHSDQTANLEGQVFTAQQAQALSGRGRIDLGALPLDPGFPKD